MFGLLLCLGCAVASAVAQLPAGRRAADQAWSREITLQQLTEYLAAARQNGQSDDKTSRRLARIHLSERLTDERLEKLTERTGPKTRETLRVLAEESTFRDLAEADRLSDPPPSLQEFRLIAARAAAYTTNYVRNLPDFLCTRTTRLYTSRSTESWASLRLHATAEGELSYNRGVESYAHRSGRKGQLGLTSFGEYGAIIAALFLGDSSPQIRWGHWERLNGARVAVFRYSIDAAHSRYALSDFGWYYPVTKNVAYTGRFVVEPDSGAILRVTRQALGLTGFRLGRADTFVEYSRVGIGGKSYVCPSWSVIYAGGYVGEVRFTNYRKFATDSTISVQEPAP